jgi:tRNA-dihydrouridine synthase 2
MICFKNKKILAPMVRVSKLPFRLRKNNKINFKFFKVSLENGADIVFSEELIDRKLLQTKRTFNEKLKIIEYIYEKDNSVVFQTCKEDHPLILQIGTSSPEF